MVLFDGIDSHLPEIAMSLMVEIAIHLVLHKLSIEPLSLTATQIRLDGGLCCLTLLVNDLLLLLTLHLLVIFGLNLGKQITLLLCDMLLLVVMGRGGLKSQRLQMLLCKHLALEEVLLRLTMAKKLCHDILLCHVLFALLSHILVAARLTLEREALLLMTLSK